MFNSSTTLCTVATIERSVIHRLVVAVMSVSKHDNIKESLCRVNFQVYSGGDTVGNKSIPFRLIILYRSQTGTRLSVPPLRTLYLTFAGCDIVGHNSDV